MRHQKAGRALASSPAHRLALLKNLGTALLTHQRIKTTVPRAKELRRFVEPLITLGKRGDLSARRRALRSVKTKPAISFLFGEAAERYSKRQGGYTRIIPIGPRRGDCAPMALVVLVDGPHDPFKDKGNRRTRRPSRQSRQETIEAAIKPTQTDEKELQQHPTEQESETSKNA